jgi:hypothetical protein
MKRETNPLVENVALNSPATLPKNVWDVLLQSFTRELFSKTTIVLMIDEADFKTNQSATHLRKRGKLNVNYFFVFDDQIYYFTVVQDFDFWTNQLF